MSSLGHMTCPVCSRSSTILGEFVGRGWIRYSLRQLLGSYRRQVRQLANTEVVDGLKIEFRRHRHGNSKVWKSGGAHDASSRRLFNTHICVPRIFWEVEVRSKEMD